MEKESSSTSSRSRSHRPATRSATGLDRSSAKSPAGGDALKELVGHLREVDSENRDILRDLIDNWQKVVGGIVAALLCVWVVTKYFEKEELKSGQASALFSEIQSTYSSLEEAADLPADGKAIDPAAAAQARASKLRGVEDSLSSMRERFPGSSYVKLAALYKANLHAASIRSGSSDAARIREELKDFELNRFDGLTAPVTSSPNSDSAITEKTAELFLDEMAVLLYARALLQNEKTRLEGRKQLQQLAYGSQFVTVEALLALVRSSGNSAERNESVEIARAVVTALGTYSKETEKLAKQELRKVGVSL